MSDFYLVSPETFVNNLHYVRYIYIMKLKYLVAHNDGNMLLSYTLKSLIFYTQ